MPNSSMTEFKRYGFYATIEGKPQVVQVNTDKGGAAAKEMISATWKDAVDLASVTVIHTDDDVKAMVDSLPKVTPRHAAVATDASAANAANELIGSGD